MTPSRSDYNSMVAKLQASILKHHTPPWHYPVSSHANLRAIDEQRARMLMRIAGQVLSPIESIVFYFRY